MISVFSPQTYADFQTLTQHFGPEKLDVFYANLPYSGVGAGAASFQVWAIDYERGFQIRLWLDQTGSVGTPLDITPGTFSTDYPTAIAITGVHSIGFFVN